MGLDSPGFDAEIDTFENVYAWSILKGVSRHFASLALDVTHDSLLFLCYFNSCHSVFSTPSQDTAQSALELGPSHCPNGRLGQDLGFGGFAFALKLPELLNTNLAAVRAKLGQTSCFPNGSQIWCPIGQ